MRYRVRVLRSRPLRERKFPRADPTVTPEIPSPSSFSREFEQ
jgi:hypothetical protein